MEALPDTTYWRTYNGRFAGVLQWAGMDALWQQLRASPEGWFVFDIWREPPAETLSGEAFAAFLDEAAQFTRSRHDHVYCGFIYVDDIDAPSFVKVFDPSGMGSSCGCGRVRNYPRWMISRLAPDPLPQVVPRQTKGLFARLFGN